tara:strand:+ start:305 stop:1237 length:933 start_codon:yes stop_codon:yes gene_type:complete
LDTKKLTLNIKELSQALGFQLVGISKANVDIEESSTQFQKWLDMGNHASMDWLNTRKEERKNIFKYFPEVKSVISFGYNYYSSSSLDSSGSNYKISNYAWGDDYHIVIKEKLFEILSYIKTYNEKLIYRVCVDTSPLMEKVWAQKSGLGWIGKHTNLINNNIGSWFFISEILLNIDLEYDNEFSKDLCGTCNKCLDACPTDALKPYILDSNKCISYLTIEHRGDIDKKYEKNLNDWIYGCDICQDVCPWNIKFSEETTEKRFLKKKEIKEMNRDDWNNLTKEEYQKIFKNSAVKRTKLEGISRNIKLNKN